MTSAERIASAGAPADRITWLASLAMPRPAAPAPRKTSRWPVKGSPLCRRAARMPATTTAAVPWMSSLKLGSAAR